MTSVEKPGVQAIWLSATVGAITLGAAWGAVVLTVLTVGVAVCLVLAVFALFPSVPVPTRTNLGPTTDVTLEGVEPEDLTAHLDPAVVDIATPLPTQKTYEATPPPTQRTRNTLEVEYASCPMAQ